MESKFGLDWIVFQRSEISIDFLSLIMFFFLNKFANFVIFKIDKFTFLS